jgi:hypothetical protein
MYNALSASQMSAGALVIALVIVVALAAFVWWLYGTD